MQTLPCPASLFAGVRLRTDVGKRMRRRENALYLVLKIAQRLEHSWRPLNGGLTVMTLLLGRARFVDGVYVPQSVGIRGLSGRNHVQIPPCLPYCLVWKYRPARVP